MIASTLFHRRHGLTLLASIFIAGCAQPPLTSPPANAETPIWRGRLALRVEGDPPQSLAGGFELRGSAQHGELLLFSPLGQTLAQLKWQTGTAELTTNGSTSTYPSLDALATAATGTLLPITALFAWLNGDATTAEGWTADLSQQNEGRLRATRRWPLPLADLRIALEH